MKKWKTEEIDRAIELLKIGKSYDEISILLNRTKKSIKCKMYKNNLSFYDFYDYDKNNEIVKCLYCEKEFISLKSENRKFCSLSCSASYNNKTTKIIHGIYTKEQKTFLNCDFCGKIIEKNARISSRFCSRKCYQENRWNLKIEDILKGIIECPNTLKKYLSLKNGNNCEICGINEWKNKKLILVLDHIDGDPYNNIPSNLRLLCPNCDAQLDTFTGKNKGNGRIKRRERYNKEKLKIENNNLNEFNIMNIHIPL